MSGKTRIFKEIAMALETSQPVIREVASEFIVDQLMFTAYEVSKEVQKRLSERELPFERHFNMREYVHQTLRQYIQSGQYRKKQHDVGADIPADLYYPVGADPNQYVPMSRGARPTVQGAATAEQTPPTTTRTVHVPVTGTVSVSGASTQATDAARRGDARGTLAVPSPMLRAIGFNHRETAYVFNRTDSMGHSEIVVVKTLPENQPALSEYTVDDGGNVRITAATLQEGGLTVGTDALYSFTQGPGEVVVRNHY
jgi:hypothetical protein